MKRSFLALGLLFAACLCVAGAAADGAAGEPAGSGLSYALPQASEIAPPTGPWTSRVLGIPGPEPVEKRGFAGLPTFSRNVVARGRSYRFTMVGSDPFAPRSGQVVVPLQLIPVRVVFNDGTILDPTVPGPDCAGPGTPLTNTLQSPLLTDTDFGNGDGPRQYVEENRRREFWAVTRTNPRYSVRLAPVVLPTVTLTFDGPSLAAPCGPAGIIPHAALDPLIRTSIIPQLKKQGVSPRTLPLFLLANVAISDADGLALGYHTAFNSGGAQTYGVAEYDTSQFDRHAANVSVLSHELAEWYDDPFVNNATPPWGHTGQVTGCQANLEVGDPLSGQVFDVPMSNGVTYHLQEVAFFSWFFDQVPSLGIDGLYSWAGTLSGPASPCH
jgi:hypothetical protein